MQIIQNYTNSACCFMSKAKQQTVKPGIQQCCVQQAST